MTFLIKPIDRKTFDAIWTPELAEKIDKFIYPTKNWSDDVGLRGGTWMVDESARAYLLMVSLADRMEAAIFCYAFIKQGEFALIREEGYSLYSFVTVSSGLVGRLDEVKGLISEALRVGGKGLDGRTDRRLFNIPNAQFVQFSESGGNNHDAQLRTSQGSARETLINPASSSATR